ncbi:MAG TPA: SUF system Fe-S cluster assembly protein [Bacteroidales bacterium]|nr:SUF system Fe-S cluster assembly protein [Bacteroidales bacterium]
MAEKTIIDIETEIVRTLKNIYDPEIPVNIYELGLIYEIEVDDDHNVEITMTLTAPNCPVADHLLEDIERQVSEIEGVQKATITLTFDPPWDQSMLSDEARLELGLM